MLPPADGHLRAATVEDGPQLLPLWASLFDGVDSARQERWWSFARDWFARVVDDPDAARFPVVEVDHVVVATAIGTLELGVPNPQCPTGRTVRLANVVTLPAHRGHGHATLLTHDVVRWARSIAADRVDLSATPDGRRIYEKAGFVLTSAPRMKLVL